MLNPYLNSRESRLRAKPGLKLLPLLGLPKAHRKTIRRVYGADIASVVFERASESIVSAVDNDTSRLISYLSTPHRLSNTATGVSAARRAGIAAKLVADGVLEITDFKGVFRSGISAHDFIFSRKRTSGSSNGLDRLSYLALLYATLLPHSFEAEELAYRLYTFNSVPLTAEWERRLATPAAITASLGLSHAPVKTLLRSAFRSTGHINGRTPWIQWTLKEFEPSKSLHYKIYVSTPLENLSDVVETVAGICERLRLPVFKVGTTLRNLLRPDRLIIYATDDLQLHGAIDALRCGLGQCEGSGVPFTAPVSRSPALSWGVDPATDDMGGSALHASWRSTIASLIGATIAKSKSFGSADEIIRFCLGRLRLEGIEPFGWQMRDVSDG
jgi:hypothetical protein